MVAHAKGLQLLRAPSSLSVTTNAIASPNSVEDYPQSTTQGLRSVLSKAKTVEGAATAVSAPNAIPSLQQQGRLQQQPTLTGEKKTVRFNRTIYNRRIPHLNDLSLKLRHEIWIQPDEYQAIRNRCVVTVKMMMRGDLPLVDEGGYNEDRAQQQRQQHCVRGLEGKTRDGSIRRKQYKHDSITAVLDEQQYYWENITNSSSSSSSDSDQQEQQQQEPDVAIMEAYKVYTSSCAQQARELAERDEEFVRQYVRRCEDDGDDDGDQCGDSDDDDDDDESQHEYHSCDDEYMSDDDDDDDMSVPCVEDIIEKLSNVVSLKGQRAAMLFEIERNFYEEPSIGPYNSGYSAGDDDDENCGDEYNQDQGEADSGPISSTPSPPQTSVSSFVSMALSISSSSRLSSPPSLIWDEEEEDSSGTLSCTSSMEEDVGRKDSTSPLSATSFPGNKIQGRQYMLMEIRKRLTFTSTPMSTSTPATSTAPAEVVRSGKKTFWGRKSTPASSMMVRGGEQGLSASLHI